MTKYFQVDQVKVKDLNLLMGKLDDRWGQRYGQDQGQGQGQGQGVKVQVKFMVN